MMGVAMARAKPKPGQQQPPKRIGLPTKERAAKAAGVVDEPTERAGVMVKRIQAPLDFLYARSIINQRQFSAGDRLRTDHAFGVLGVRDPENSGVGSIGYGPTDAALDAGRSYALAIRTLCLSVMIVVDAVVCDEEGVQAVAKRRGIHPQEAMGYFKAGLDTLADHYDRA